MSDYHDIAGVLAPSALRAQLEAIPRPTEAEVEQSEREAAWTTVRDGWFRDSPSLPDMPFARIGNDVWLRGIDRRIIAALRATNLRKRGLIILGPTGSGKTTALIARLFSLREHARRRVLAGEANPLPRFMWTSEAALKAAKQSHPLGRGESPVIRRSCTRAHLFVDEVGPAPDIELLHATIFDHRYNHGLPTTITSGLTLEQLRAQYGIAMVRRLAQHATVVDLHTGAST